MGEIIIVKIPLEGEITVAAYCLKTDCWQDYISFKEDIMIANANGDQRNTNRFLRAALTCLFSHLEAVVNDIEKSCEIPRVHIGTRLCDKTRNIGEEAKKIRKIPFMNFRLEKHLRDLIAHPGIQINFSQEQNRKLDFVDVFERLNIETLEKIEAQLSPWLDAVCEAFEVSRFTDTRQLVDGLSKELGTTMGIHEV